MNNYNYASSLFAMDSFAARLFREPVPVISDPRILARPGDEDDDLAEINDLLTQIINQGRPRDATGRVIG